MQVPARTRIESVDLLRGLVMVVMALDHTRDYFGQPGISPTNLEQATAALFFTRWITNICVPVFFLLTGIGAALALGKKTNQNFPITCGPAAFGLSSWKLLSCAASPGSSTSIFTSLYWSSFWPWDGR